MANKDIAKLGLLTIQERIDYVNKKFKEKHSLFNSDIDWANYYLFVENTPRVLGCINAEWLRRLLPDLHPVLDMLGMQNAIRYIGVTHIFRDILPAHARYSYGPENSVTKCDGSHEHTASDCGAHEHMGVSVGSIALRYSGGNYNYMIFPYIAQVTINIEGSAEDTQGYKYMYVPCFRGGNYFKKLEDDGILGDCVCQKEE